MSVFITNNERKRCGLTLVKKPARQVGGKKIGPGGRVKTKKKKK
jgi:hypothetical protein